MDGIDFGNRRLGTLELGTGPRDPPKRGTQMMRVLRDLGERVHGQDVQPSEEWASEGLGWW